MPWQFWVGLSLGLVAGAFVGFLAGRMLRAAADAQTAIDAVEAADQKADEQREDIEAGLARVLKETRNATGKELEDALNDDFARPPALPTNHPLRTDGRSKR